MKNIELEPLKQDNLNMILSWRNHPEVRKNMYTSHEISQQEHINWFNKISNDKSKEYFVFYLNNNPLGVIGFTEIDMNSKQCSWAFYANPEAPRGTGSLMEFSALEYIFKTKGIRKLNCEVLSFNSSVIKMHKKFGFKQEGQIREGHFNGKGYHDIVMLGLFASEWQEISPIFRKKLKLA